MSKYEKAQPKNSAPVYIYVLIAIAIACIFFSIYKKKKVEREFQKRALESAQLKLKENKALTPSENQAMGRDSFANIQSRSRLTSPTATSAASQIRRAPPRPPTPTIHEMKANTSKATIESFTKEAHISVPLPGNFTYNKLDMPEGFAGIYGVDGNKGARVTGLAYNRTATPDQVTEFLKTDSDSIPNISQNKVGHISAPEPLPPPAPNSGFSKGTMWNGKLENGDDVAIVYIERADQKGSYLFVLSAPGQYFRNNDGAFDGLYEKARALDQQGK